MTGATPAFRRVCSGGVRKRTTRCKAYVYNTYTKNSCTHNRRTQERSLHVVPDALLLRFSSGAPRRRPSALRATAAGEFSSRAVHSSRRRRRPNNAESLVRSSLEQKHDASARYDARRRRRFLDGVHGSRRPSVLVRPLVGGCM